MLLKDDIHVFYNFPESYKHIYKKFLWFLFFKKWHVHLSTPALYVVLGQ